MIVIGVVLILIALVLAAVLIPNGVENVSMNFAGVSLDTTASWFFVAGLVAAALALLGIWCIRFGTRRSLRNRKKNRALRKEAEANREAAASTQQKSTQQKSTQQKSTQRDRPDGRGPDDGNADTYFDSTPRE